MTCLRAARRGDAPCRCACTFGNSHPEVSHLARTIGDVKERQRDRSGDPKGDKTESLVHNLYRELGYSVQPNVLVTGNQTDVVAERDVPGSGRHRLLIEVKHRLRGAVPKDDVIKFAAVVDSAVRQGIVERGVMVTTTSFSAPSKVHVEGLPVELFTVAELQRQVMPVAAPLRRQLERYRRNPANDLYIDLGAKLTHAHAATAKPPKTPRASQLLEIAMSAPARAVLIFADYGAGKTTTIEKIRAEAIAACLADDRSPIPILFDLKRLNQNEPIETFIRDVLRDELDAALEVDTFWDLLDAGNLLLLLDGFDEIALRVDETGRAALLRRISPLLFGRSAAILTSRPSYFVSAAEYRRLIEALRSAGGYTSSSAEESPTSHRRQQASAALRKLHQTSARDQPLDPHWIAYDLELLESTQVDDYLDRHRESFARAGTTPKTVRGFIDSVYDLEDLVTRPIILHLVCQLVSQQLLAVTDVSATFGPADLYSIYTEDRMVRDFDNVASRQMGLGLAQRKAFAEAAAVHMSERQVLEVPQTELAGLVRDAKVSLKQMSLEECLTDLRTCSFLTVTDTGDLRFIHRSFQEFFMASRVKDGIAVRNYRHLGKPLGPNVLYFLGSFAASDGELHQQLVELTRSPKTINHVPSDVAADNLATALLYSNEAARKLDWRDRTAADVKRRSLALRECTLRNVALTDARIGALRIDRSTELDVDLPAVILTQLAVSMSSGRVAISGSCAEIEIRSATPKLELADESTGETITVEDSKVDLRGRSRSPKRIAATQSRVTAEVVSGDQVTLSACDATIEHHGQRIWQAQVAGSRLTMTAATFGSLFGELSDTVIRITGKTGEGRGRQGFRSRLKLHRCVLASPAGVEPNLGSVDGAELLVLGGRWTRTNGEATWTGIMFRPSRSPRATDTVEARVLDKQRIIIEGTGPRWSALTASFDAAAARINSGPLSTGGGTLRELRELFDAAGIVDGSIQQVLALAVDLSAGAVGSFH